MKKVNSIFLGNSNTYLIKGKKGYLLKPQLDMKVQRLFPGHGNLLIEKNYKNHI